MHIVRADINPPIFLYVESWNDDPFSMSVEAFQARLDILPLAPEIQGKQPKNSPDVTTTSSLFIFLDFDNIFPFLPQMQANSGEHFHQGGKPQICY